MKRNSEQFDFYGYAAASNGEWRIDNVTYSCGKSHITKEQFQAYQDAGMTIFFPQDEAAIDPSDVAGTLAIAANTCKVAYESGLDRIILCDRRIQNLSQIEGGLVGKGKHFETYEALDAEIASYLSDYKDWKGFYGVVLRDEPKYAMLEAYADVYKSIKRVCPDCFVHYNLVPMMRYCVLQGYYPEVGAYRSHVSMGIHSSALCSEVELEVRFRKMLEDYIDATGADYVQYDDYPLTQTDIAPFYLRGLQVSAQVVKEKNVDLDLITQTFSMGNSEHLEKRIVKEEDLRWLNNSLLGFGVKNIAFFTYFTKKVSVTKAGGENFIDGASMINRDGMKTPIYYAVQKLLKEDQAFAPVIKHYNYRSARHFIGGEVKYPTEHVKRVCPECGFLKLADFAVDRECALVTELENESGCMYMYMNATDPIYGHEETKQTATLTFPAEYKKARVYCCGKAEEVPLSEAGTLTLSASGGEAYYVIPIA